MIRNFSTFINSFNKLNNAKVQFNNKRRWISPFGVNFQAFVIGVFIILAGGGATFAEESLQELIDQTPAYGTLQLEGRSYEGNITISNPITIIGTEKSVIKGEGKGNVVTINTSDVVLENIEVTNSGQDRNSGEEYAAIKIMEDRNTLNNIRITNSFHGVYLSQAHKNKISNVNVRGRKNGEIAGQGNGLHLYYSNDNELLNNHIDGTRDGIFFDYSNRNIATNNKVEHTRYGLHYMYSDDNQFYDNAFNYNIGGAAIMHSNRIILKNNQFTLNQGTRSYGLLLQSSNENVVMENLFFQNQRGIYFDQSQKSIIKDNKFLQNQIGIEVWASSSDQLFCGNQFSNNIAAVLTLGGKDKNQWFEHNRGNYWGHSIPVLDLDQNGVGDDPIEYKSSLYQLVEENELAYLFLKSPAIGIYEKMNEVLNREEVMVTDQYPLIQHESIKSTNILFIIGSLLLLIIGSVYIKRRREQ